MRQKLAAQVAELSAQRQSRVHSGRMSYCDINHCTSPNLNRLRAKKGGMVKIMSAQAYIRRLLIGCAILVILIIGAPLVILQSVYRLCRGQGGGCGDVGLVFIFFGAVPALVGILGFFAWTVYRRLRYLRFSITYLILTCLLLTGCLQSVLFAVTGAPLSWEIIAPPLLATLIMATLCLVPEVNDRGTPNLALRNALVIISILLLARLASAILYPLWLLPGGLELSSDIQRLSLLGPLRFIPDVTIIAAFAMLLLATLKQWRDPSRRQ